jgi:hypothetical protein
MTTIIEIRTDPENRMSIDTGTLPVSYLDSIALRLGLQLILWGQRQHPTLDPAELHRRQQVREQAETERQAFIAKSHHFRM